MSLVNFLGHSGDTTEDNEDDYKNAEKESDEKEEDCSDNCDKSLGKDPSKQVIEIKKDTNYWLSDKARAKKSAYMREYQRRKKQEQQDLIERLKRHQLRARSITLMNISGKTAVRKIECEDDYERLISDLLSTLVDNGLLNDFSIESLQ